MAIFLQRTFKQLFSIVDWSFEQCPSATCQVYTGAVNVAGVANTVAQCLIHDGPHVGVLLGGNDNVIELNDISRIALEFVDMGAIYMNTGLHPFVRGRIIRNNFIHHLGTLGTMCCLPCCISR